jgi:hypothetical protein
MDTAAQDYFDPSIAHRRRSSPDEVIARIWRPARSTLTSAPQRNRPWRLVFERRTAPWIEPLMGWTGGDEPLAQVRLSFPDLQSAIAYAKRQGLDYVVRHELPSDSARDDAFADLLWANAAINSAADQHRKPLPAALERAMFDPASVFASPADVVSHPNLDLEQKREILRRWAWDEYLAEIASDEAMTPAAEGTRFAEVKSALLQLEEAGRNLLVVAGSTSATG